MNTLEKFYAKHLDSSSDRPKRVAVVGAGLAGLACADKLIRAGHTVDVFEARSRVGGRVFSQHLSQRPGTVEAGGEFIGKNHKQWQAYAQEFQLPLAPTEEIESSRWFYRGQPIADKQNNDIQRVLREYRSHMTFLAESINSSAPWKMKGARHWDAMSVRQWIDQQDFQNAMHYNAVLADVEGLNGIAAEKQSMLGHLCQIRGGGLQAYWTDSQTDRCVGGNDQLATALHKRIGTEHVHMGRAVTSFTSALAPNGPMLEFGHGVYWRGDAVVLTAPPTCWDTLNFSGGMPVRRLPQMSRTVKHLTYLPADAMVGQTDSHHSNRKGIAYEMWPVASSGRAPHAVVTFVPIRERVALHSLRATVEASLHQLKCRTTSAFEHQLFDWSEEPFTRGGYAFPAPGEISQIGERLYTEARGLLFAGDWAQYSHSGYMEGALRSGVRAASLIIDQDPL